MLHSWLDETYPNMPIESRNRMAETMDMSLLEKKKEESMKTFYEINNVVRMSFIEMQYMKKEMMNAMNAMDTMMSANDINMNVAAITPAVILAYTSSRFFRFLYYAFLKLGTSRAETYARFRKTLVDIERLLVMRNGPPSAGGEISNQSDLAKDFFSAKLESDDLGMLTLLVHECRSLMWQNKRRFTMDAIQGVSEDLSELTGERGKLAHVAVKSRVI